LAPDCLDLDLQLGNLSEVTAQLDGLTGDLPSQLRCGQLDALAVEPLLPDDNLA
jgi:hypothetical protein